MQQQFVGLTMPVFTAFGWAGEETALNYALSQLEQFIVTLHATMSRRAQTHFPNFGLSRESQSVFLAASQTPDDDIFLAFNARPMSLEIQLGITEQMALSRAWKAAGTAPERWRQLLHDLGPQWSLHVKQMEVDEEAGTRSSYQDLFKDGVMELTSELAESVSSRANFLNGEEHWVVPIFISRRVPAEQVASMGTGVIDVMDEQVEELMPLVEFLTNKSTVRKKKSKKAKPVAERPRPTVPKDVDPDRQFVYVAQLKPLHIRRGFVNLTPEHWDFFADSARATTREITLAFEDQIEKHGSAVWRLTSNDMARIVLGDLPRYWLEETFEPDDRVQVTATRMDNDEIEVILEPSD